MLKVKHDGTDWREPAERCCLCRDHTRYWHRSDVALCQACAVSAKLRDLPTKKDWIAKERALMGGRGFV